MSKAKRKPTPKRARHAKEEAEMPAPRHNNSSATASSTTGSSTVRTDPPGSAFFRAPQPEKAPAVKTSSEQAPAEKTAHPEKSEHSEKQVAVVEKEQATQRAEAAVTQGQTPPAAVSDPGEVAASQEEKSLEGSSVPPPWARINRICVTEVSPVVEEGRWPAKAVEGEAFPVQATVFREGHDVFGADAVLLRPADPALAEQAGYNIYDRTPIEWEEVSRARLVDIARGLNRYEAWLMPPTVGRYAFRVESWSDPYLSWVHDATVKIQNHIDVELMLEEGARILERALAGQALNNPDQQKPSEEDAQILHRAVEGLRDASQLPQTRLSAGVHASVRRVLRHHPLRDLLTRTGPYPLRVDRERALAGAWYEIFPRCEGSWESEDGQRHGGTLRTAAERLDYVRDCGYDVIYLTPIHPIGTTFRKGRNNSLYAAPGDPGSPYAIGSGEGGHDAIHPELGTFADFDYFVSQARDRGLEVALDLALQCSPDHPWVREHPEWFSVRADGTIAYAENPPKKYQDIYPLNFDRDYPGLYRAIRDVIQKWIDHGVTIFRVDNPHTKPVAFWQEILAYFHQKHPEVLFLAEAFTAPAMMRGLAKVGFHQSYTYFAWRNTKEEITEYLVELSQDTAHVLRPAFWPITHDILTPFMQWGGERAFKLRALLAATAAPTYGILAGYEFVENVPREGFEEQADNPKYEIKVRDWSKADDLGMVTLLRNINNARQKHVALRRLRGIVFHPTESDSIICFSKHVPAHLSPTGQADTIIAVINLDPHNAVSTWVHLDVAALGLAGTGGMHDGRPLFMAHDELTGQDFPWGADNFVRIDPWEQPGHLLSIEPL